MTDVLRFYGWGLKLKLNLNSERLDQQKTQFELREIRSTENRTRDAAESGKETLHPRASIEKSGKIRKKKPQEGRVWTRAKKVEAGRDATGDGWPRGAHRD